MDKKKTDPVRSVLAINPKVRLGLYLLLVGLNQCNWDYIKHGILIFWRGAMEVLGVRYGKTWRDALQAGCKGGGE